METIGPLYKSAVSENKFKKYTITNDVQPFYDFLDAFDKKKFDDEKIDINQIFNDENNNAINFTDAIILFIDLSKNLFYHGYYSYYDIPINNLGKLIAINYLYNTDTQKYFTKLSPILNFILFVGDYNEINNVILMKFIMNLYKKNDKENFIFEDMEIDDTITTIANMEKPNSVFYMKGGMILDKLHEMDQGYTDYSQQPFFISAESTKGNEKLIYLLEEFATLQGAIVKDTVRRYIGVICGFYSIVTKHTPVIDFSTIEAIDENMHICIGFDPAEKDIPNFTKKFS